MAMAMAMAMVDSIAGLIIIILMLALILLLLLLACKPWRFFFSSSSAQNRQIRVVNPADDIEKPLVSNDSSLGSNQRNDFDGSHVFVGPSIQSEGNFCAPRSHGIFNKQRVQPSDLHISQGTSLVLDVISDPSEDLLLGHTLKRTAAAGWSVEDRKSFRKEESNYLPTIFDDGYQASVLKNITDQRSSLALEVISGPSCGLRCLLQSTNTSRLPLTLGRVPPSDLLLKDSEVSGKHALINWNLNKLKWELVDMGSLNGTLLNSQAICHIDSGHRHWSEPIELASGDIITLGTTSKVFVQITPYVEHHIPFGVGVASDPMAFRQGGKKLPMEDVFYIQWPLPGVEQFGLFGIFDGHGGVGAAKTASKKLPEMVANILSVSERRERVLSCCDASETLRDAFLQTEALMNHQYEGCTATVLLVWANHHADFFAQCANVGDSAGVINVGDKQIILTEDHRITSRTERTRLRKSGAPLKDGEARLCGLNIARMLGDKFLKEQEARFSSEPYVSEVVHIPKSSEAFALLASDGLWDVIGIKKAIQLVIQARGRYNLNDENSAERVANFVLSEARTLRTKDNTSIIYLDFDTNRTAACNLDS